ncbi:MAG: MFS transporter [Anaerolinea sp.]|nr:MFS transporter [Anaerolinea sp.]
MTNPLRSRLSIISRELALFAVASFAVGMAGSLVDSTFNNFLNDSFSLSGFQRAFLEFPRELPGFIVVFVSALLWFLGSRKLGAVSLLLGGIGIFLVGFASKTYTVMVVFLFIFSLGQHLFMPVASTIGMELASNGKTGRRLGQLNAIRNLAAISGSALVFLGFKYFGFTFEHTFAIAALCFAVTGVLLAVMKPSRTPAPKTYLKLRKEYKLFYVLASLFGSRKQIFITFAPWVIVTIFNKPAQTIATLIVIGGVIGILFQPILGKAIDHLGEKVVLAAEAVLFVFVCFGYGFSRPFFSERTAFLITCACFLVDQALMSVSMARSTYIKKIAIQDADIQPALSASVTIDHFFSIGVALLGGIIWNRFGFQYVFLIGVAIAAANFFMAMKIRIPNYSDTTEMIEMPASAD